MGKFFQPNRSWYFVVAGLVFFLAASRAKSSPREEWFRGLDLEPALGESSLVMVARVAEVRTTKISVGGKGERSLYEYRFVPMMVLKGVFSRESLSLTSDDLGVQSVADFSSIAPGDLHLLILGRSSEGYTNFRPAPNLNRSVPPLRDANDPLLDSVKVLLAVNAATERPRKIVLLRDALRSQSGPAAVPLLLSLARRPLLAAQTPNVLEAIAPRLSDASPSAREQAARTLHDVLEADYQDQPSLREGAVNALAEGLQRADSNPLSRVAAFEALGSAGQAALDNSSARALLEVGSASTFAEQGARLLTLGKLKALGERDAVLAMLRQLPLDAPPHVQYDAEWALARLGSMAGIGEVALRLKRKYDAGLPVVTEINVLGDLDAADAVPALLDASRLPLDRPEQYAFASSCAKLADARLVAPLAGMLVPSHPNIWMKAVESLIKIDTDEAARALAPHLREETDLMQKLKIAEFLGRHGIRDGYAYAIEHMSEPYLREQAVSALAAIREPRAADELRRILATSNDAAWNNAAIRALGRLGAADFAPEFLETARNANSPLAPSALIALGDLHEAKVLDIVREGFSSRNPDLVTAAARAAGGLAGLAGVNADDVREKLASLLVDAGAPVEARAAALDSLVALKDQRLDNALALAARDAGLEGSDLLDKIEKLLRGHKVKLSLP